MTGFRHKLIHNCFTQSKASRSMVVGGEGQGGLSALWILKLLAKKVVFSISMGKNQTSPLLPPPWYKFWENSLLSLPGKNPSDAHE